MKQITVKHFLRGVAPWLFLATLTGASLAQSLQVNSLQCEYRANPQGMDEVRPRLSWKLHSGERGQKQTAYRILVASTAERLQAEQGDLWDSGKVPSSETIQIAYQGQALASRARAWWKVRAWDKDGRAAPWSETASWTMGLLSPGDWKARWIAHATSVQQAETVTTTGPHNGYHSELAHNRGIPKWVAIDLGKAQTLDSVRLWPARPYDWQPDTPGFLFPVRFKIEVAEKPDFAEAQTVVDRCGEDLANPGTNAPAYQFGPVTARYVRLMAARLGVRSGNDYGLALAEMEVLSEGRNIAKGAKVTALDSIETGAWAKANLVDGRTRPESSGAGLAAKPGTHFRKEFTVPGGFKRATAYVTGLGLYELRINGQRVGEQLLAPEWTNYRKRIQYQTCDVTSCLRAGNNAAAALVGDGWYMGRLMGIAGNAYGAYHRFLLQLEIELANGQIQTVVTDDSWRTSVDGPITQSGIYDGETFDARKGMAGWDTPGFDEVRWKPVRAVAVESVPLVWQRNEPIQVIQEFKPRAMTEPRPGLYVFDLGQNMVGWCRLKVEGPAGTTVTIRHAEMLNDDGTIYTPNLRGAPQIDRYTMRGSGMEVYEPHFTYHGFRYVELTGLPGRPGADAVLGRVFQSAAPDAGTFECSSPLLNQLMHNVLWTQRANLMSSPTDCPQRDERFGWMGDIQAFSQTAIFNLNLAAFFTKWVQDIRDDQADDGRYPDFSPHPGNPNTGGSGTPAWGDAGTVVPWRTYQNYGDKRILGDHFESAKRWVDYIHRNNSNLVWTVGRGGNYNDWLNGDTLIYEGWPKKGGEVPPDVLATAFFAHSTEIVAKMAGVLKRTEEAQTYRRLFDRIKDVFNQRFVAADGRITGDTQAGYALALNFNLLPEAMRPSAVRHALAGIQRYGGHLSTGIQTSHRLMLELTRFGQHAEAFRLVNLRDFPSWGLMIDNGATTIWERWDGYVKGRGFQNPGMNSFNHWAFGAVGEWVWRHIAGINPDEAEPGFKHFSIRPRGGDQLTWATGRYDSIRGLVASDWRIENGRLRLTASVPPNATATVYVPTREVAAVKEGDQPAAEAQGVRYLGLENGTAIYEVESGQYSFSAPQP